MSTGRNFKIPIICKLVAHIYRSTGGIYEWSMQSILLPGACYRFPIKDILMDNIPRGVYMVTYIFTHP